MKFAFGTKEEMTQIFSENGKLIPVTSINLEPAVVTQIKTNNKDGYFAIQVGFGTQKKERVKKPQLGHLKDKGPFLHLKEIRMTEESIKNFKEGDKIEIDLESGDKTDVSGISKAKGFQGVVKRHGFSGGPRSHGQKHTERAPGSIGIGGVQRVMKGMRMAGRTGGDLITTKNLKVIQLDKENNKIFIEGAVPGRRGTMLQIISR